MLPDTDTGQVVHLKSPSRYGRSIAILGILRGDGLGVREVKDLDILAYQKYNIARGSGETDSQSVPRHSAPPFVPDKRKESNLTLSLARLDTKSIDLRADRRDRDLPADSNGLHQRRAAVLRSDIDTSPDETRTLMIDDYRKDYAILLRVSA
ncbi:hypothetical protein BKA93DRAFT_746163 [Sparassis latifolia]